MDLDQSLREYWKWRLATHFNDRYKGRELIKFPEDLRTYQKVIEETRPTVLIELGTNDGGSAWWFYDQMVGINGAPRWVFTVDLRPVEPLPDGPWQVSMLTGDLRDPAIIARIGEGIDPEDRVMVVDDSEHSLHVTTSALNLYSRFVTPGCYFVVEDGIVDEPLLSIWPGVSGVQPAIEQFLTTDVGREFTREWRADYGLTMHQGGWLRRGEA